MLDPPYSASAPRQGRTARGRREAAPWWATLDDEELLDVRICDLGLRVEGSELEERVERLHQELEARGLRLKPHVWLSHEWFSPDGVPGFAVPFYLAHDRLKRLERKMMLEVEGGTRSSCMKLMRHETGHCVSTAYRLHYRKRWREVFGSTSQPYPESYLPRAQTKHFVLHLEWWYAQAHPAEDFAETFAVWLNPNSRWRQNYRGWPALLKLRYVHDTMAKLVGVAPPVRSRERVETLRTLRYTLREHYRNRQATYGDQSPDIYDRDLRRLFSDEPRDRERPAAAQFLRRHRREIREQVARWTGEYVYTIDRVLHDMTSRSRELKLRLRNSESQSLADATTLVTVQTMNFLRRVPHRIQV